MKKLLIAFVAGFMSLSLAGAYAADDIWQEVLAAPPNPAEALP